MLHCLGDLRLERNGLPELPSRRKPLALLTWLHRRGANPASRDELADLFWGDSGDANARKSLRQSLFELRAVLGEAMIESAHGVRLDPSALTSDLQRFEEAFTAGQWASALDAWAGDLVPDGEGLGSEPWREWLERERLLLRKRLGIACHHLTAMAEERGAWLDVARAAAHWRSLLPDDARAWLREINGLQSAGRVADAAIRQAEAEQHFTRNLDVPVPEEIARLGRVLDRIRDVAGVPTAHLLTPDLVGRGEVMSLLAQARQHVRGSSTGGRSVTLVAAEGLGKTRVLGELARQAREHGDTVIEAAALTIERDRPLALCRTILARIASHPALAGCPPESLAILARVAPELREAFRHLPPAPASDGQPFVEAFARALNEIATAKPVVLALDDFPDADWESIAGLGPLILRPPAGMLIVAAGRPESWRARPEVIDLLGRVDPSGKLTLERLTVNDVRSMLASMAPIAAGDLDALANEFHRLSGGNPAAVTSLTTHAVITGLLAQRESGEWTLVVPSADPARIPPNLDEQWKARYARYDTGTQLAVDALAVLESGAPGRPVEHALWERVSRLPAVGFRAAAEALGASGVVEISDARARFGMELHRRMAYAGIGPATREQLHARAANAMRGTVMSSDRRVAAAYHRGASGRARPRFGVPAVAAAVILILAVAGWLASTRASHVPAGSPVLLIDVDNATGESTFGRTMQLAVSVGMQQSRQITIFPRSRVRETLQLMQRPGADSLLDETLGREVAIRENLPRVIAFAIGSVDSAYLVTARIIEPHSGRDLFVATERAPSRGTVLSALDRLIHTVRRATGEPVDSVRQYGLPLPRVTTSSLAALQAYATGTAFWSRRLFADAQASYLRAVELDSGFAMAWVGLAELYIQAAVNRPAGDSALARAVTLVDRLTERERLRLDQAVALSLGLQEDAVRVSRRLAERFPERDTWYNYGTALMRSRRCPEAIPALGRAIAFDSSFAAAHINVATCHQFLGDYGAAVSAYERAHRSDPSALYRGTLNHEYGIALVRTGLVDSARRVYARMSQRPEAGDQQFGHRSLGYLAAYQGRYREGTAHFDTAASLAREGRVPLSEFRNRLLASEHLQSAGDDRGARIQLDSTWAAGRRVYLAPYFLMGAGIAYSRAGQLGRATAMLDSMRRTARAESPDEQTLQAILGARVALARGDAPGAREVLRQAVDTTRSDFALSALTDVYVVLGHSDSAYAAASRLADRSPFGTDGQEAWFRALLRRAQLAEGLGLPGEARRMYDQLVSLWQTADDDLPMLVEARRGLDRLARGDAAASRPVVPRR